ncbi:hypothetical protein [Rhodococcus sp. USK13]|uniref:hypothetical protein n=1 Tax=Rhodococcus sp. USK13 TaxID=2806442 RepID=UPI001BD17E16|nr:hypothetical protein [Rhodococcus sp. USK13]
MPDSIENALDAAIRSLDAVVVPAVDENHPLATEQAMLISKTLKLVRGQLPYRSTRASQELLRHIAMGQAVLPLVEWSAVLTERLSDSVSGARGAIESSPADQVILEEWTRTLSGLLCAAVRAARRGDVVERVEIESTVLRLSEPLLVDHMSWFKAQGWSASDEIPELAVRFA